MNSEDPITIQPLNPVIDREPPFFTHVLPFLLGLLLMIPASSFARDRDQVTGEASLDDISMLKQRAIRLLIGGGGLGPFQKRAVAEADAARESLLAADWVAIEWNDPAADTIGGRLSGAASQLREIASGYGDPQSRFYRSERAKEWILVGLDDLLTHFNANTPRPGNWYNWVLSLPGSLGAVALLMEDELPDSLKARLEASLKHELRDLLLDGANAVSEARNHAYLALLEMNKERLGRAAEHAFRELTYSTDFGVREDYSYLFHGRIPYAGGYGAGLARKSAELMFLFNDTQWAPSSEKRDLLVNFLVEHALWYVVGPHMDMHAVGRSYAHRRDAGSLVSAALLMSQVETAKSDELMSVVVGLLEEGAPASSSVAGFADELASVLPEPLRGFRFWPAAEMGVYKGVGYHVGFRQFSSRVQDYEYLTLSGGEGWDLSYGFTNIVRRGDEWYRGRSLHPGIDMTRLPGTTSRRSAHPFNPSTYIGETGLSLNFGTSSFSGGTGWEDGGVAGFILEPVYGSFVARKSLHFFPGGFWALGSGITSSRGTARGEDSIGTTVLQWVLEDGSTQLHVSGDRQFALSKRVSRLKDVRWLWIDNIGCVFDRPTDLSLRWENDVLVLWIDHGSDPRDAGYGYAVLPTASKEVTIRFAEGRTVWPSRRDNSVHAVRNSAELTDSVMFFEAGEWEDLSVDHPAIVYRNSDEDGGIVSVQNPLHDGAALELTCIAPGALFFPDSGVNQVNINDSEEDGRTFRFDTVLGRTHRFGYGEAGRAAGSDRREDLAALHAFDVEAFHDSETTVLSVSLPPEVLTRGYRLTVRGDKGHLLKELGDTDIIDRRAGNVVRYLWRRPVPKDDTIDSQRLFQHSGDFRLYLRTPMRFAVAYFTVPAFDEDGNIIPDAHLPVDLNKPPEQAL